MERLIEIFAYTGIIGGGLFTLIAWRVVSQMDKDDKKN